MGEEVLVHEGVVGLWVLAGDPNVLILFGVLLVCGLRVLVVWWCGSGRI